MTHPTWAAVRTFAFLPSIAGQGKRKEGSCGSLLLVGTAVAACVTSLAQRQGIRRHPWPSFVDICFLKGTSEEDLQDATRIGCPTCHRGLDCLIGMTLPHKPHHLATCLGARTVACGKIATMDCCVDPCAHNAACHFKHLGVIETLKTP
jgi:hypothetical protein